MGLDVETMGNFWYYLPVGLGALIPILAAMSKGRGGRLAWVGCLAPAFFVVGLGSLLLICLVIGASSEAGGGSWDHSWDESVAWWMKFAMGMMVGAFISGPFADH